MAVRKITVLVCLGLVCVGQLSQFTAGYLLTADDNQSRYFWLANDWSDWFETGLQVALQQSRLTQVLGILLQSVGNAWTDLVGVRALAALTMYAWLALACVHIRQFASANFSLLVFLLMIALAPMAFHHMPPTSYPFYVDLPLFLFFFIRIITFRRLSPYQHKSIIYLVGYSGAMTLTLLTSDYMLLISGIIVLASDLAAVARSGPFRRGLVESLRNRTIIAADFCILSVCLIMWVVFNVLTADEGRRYIDVGLAVPIYEFLFFVSQHALGGLSITNPGGFDLQRLTFMDGVIGVAVGGLCGLAARLILDDSGASRVSGLVSVVGGILAVVLCTFVLLIVKYQEWCAAGACLHLESRIAGMALVPAAAYFSLRAASVSGSAVRLVFAASIGLVACWTYLHNASVAEKTEYRTEIFKNIQNLKRVKSNVTGLEEGMGALMSLINEQRVPWYGGQEERRRAYIREYYKRTVASDSLEDLPTIEIGATTSAAAVGQGMPWFFGFGEPEPWGRWSLGRFGAIAFRLADGQATNLSIRFAGQVYAAPRKYKISVNGSEACTGVFEAGKKSISFDLKGKVDKDRVIFILIEVPNVTSPSAVAGAADKRELGVAIQSMTVTATQSNAERRKVSENASICR